MARLDKIRAYTSRLIYRLMGRTRFASPSEVERTEIAFYRSQLKPGQIAFDVGANVGAITLLMAELVGEEGQIHAFEPAYKTFETLQANCLASKMSNVVLNRLALADKEGEVELYVYDDEHHSLNTLIKRPLENYGLDLKPLGIDRVQATTIDRY